MLRLQPSGIVLTRAEVGDLDKRLVRNRAMRAQAAAMMRADGRAMREAQETARLRQSPERRVVYGQSPSVKALRAEFEVAMHDPCARIKCDGLCEDEHGPSHEPDYGHRRDSVLSIDAGPSGHECNLSRSPASARSKRARRIELAVTPDSRYVSARAALTCSNWLSKLQTSRHARMSSDPAAYSPARAGQEHPINGELRRRVGQESKDMPAMQDIARPSTGHGRVSRHDRHKSSPATMPMEARTMHNKPLPDAPLPADGCSPLDSLIAELSNLLMPASNEPVSSAFDSDPPSASASPLGSPRPAIRPYGRHELPRYTFKNENDVAMPPPERVAGGRPPFVDTQARRHAIRRRPLPTPEQENADELELHFAARERYRSLRDGGGVLATTPPGAGRLQRHL